jgi:Domain of unknown function (DUF4292)
MSRKILIILNIAMLLVSCKPKESLFLTKLPGKLSDRELEESILNKNKEIKTIKLSRINFSLYIDGEELKSGGTIGIIRDSVIIVSLVPALGYEITRIFCYKDKILILDRIEKIFFYTSLKKNMEKYKIQSTYNDIESLLTGRSFVYGNQMRGTRLDKSIERGNEKIKMNYDILKNEIVIMNQEIIIKNEGLSTESNNIKDIKENTDIDISYDNYINVNGFILPQKILLSVDSPEKKLKLILEIGNIVINEQINAENIIPSRYQEAIMDY